MRGSEPPCRRLRASLPACISLPDLPPIYLAAVCRLHEFLPAGHLRNFDCVSSMNLQVDVERLLLGAKGRARRAAGRARAARPLGRPRRQLAARDGRRRQRPGRRPSPRYEDMPCAKAPAATSKSSSKSCRATCANSCSKASTGSPGNRIPTAAGAIATAQSNIAATMLVQAAFRLTGIPAKYADLMVRPINYVAAQGGVAASARDSIGDDKTLLAAILANCALAGMVPWRQVPTLPFELVCLPKRWQRTFSMPVDRDATPAGARRWPGQVSSRSAAKSAHAALAAKHAAKSLTLLEQLQAADDSFLASVRRYGVRRDEPGQHRLPGASDRRARHRVSAVVRARRCKLVGRDELRHEVTTLALNSSLRTRFGKQFHAASPGHRPRDRIASRVGKLPLLPRRPPRMQSVTATGSN